MKTKCRKPFRKVIVGWLDPENDIIGARVTRNGTRWDLTAWPFLMGRYDRHMKITIEEITK